METFEYILEDKVYKTEKEMEVDNSAYSLIEVTTYGDYYKNQKRYIKGLFK